jgi:hypothetical protein
LSSAISFIFDEAPPGLMKNDELNGTLSGAEPPSAAYRLVANFRPFGVQIAAKCRSCVSVNCSREQFITY